MSNHKIDVQKVLIQLRGLKCVDFLYSDGWDLLLYFGEVENETPLRTTWRLLIECPWRVESENKVIVGSQDESEKIIGNLKLLQNLIIQEINYNNLSKDLSVLFNLGVNLRIFTTSTDEDLWQLRKSNGYRLTLEKNFNFSESMEGPDC